MVDANEAKEYVVRTCTNVLTELGNKYNVEIPRVRIDMKTLKDKPVFGLFNKSTFKGHCTLKEIIRAGGGKGMTMILGVYIKNLIRDIFSGTMKRLDFSDSKLMYVLLHLKTVDSVTIPMISIYREGQLLETTPIGDAVLVTDNPM